MGRITESMNGSIRVLAFVVVLLLLLFPTVSMVRNTDDGPAMGTRVNNLPIIAWTDVTPVPAVYTLGQTGVEMLQFNFSANDFWFYLDVEHGSSPPWFL